ncbi:MAG: hypothetical protein AAF799_01490 [Myxococcota bacterium]
MSNIRVTLAIHWEGRHLDGVKHFAQDRKRLIPGIPVTHFVSAAYFARGGDIEEIVKAMLPAFESNDEIALHVPAWQSIRGARHEPSRSVIVGDDPELVVEYPGITAQPDRGYTYPISAYEKPSIESFIVTSKLLLRPLLQAVVLRRGLNIERVLRGIRAGHGMASDVFLVAACNSGFKYDASGMDAVWARDSADRAEAEAKRGEQLFAPLWRHWADLWGSTEQNEPHLSNHGMRAGTGGAGINASTQPFFIARAGGSQLLELPVNGGVVPPASPQHVAELLTNALESPPGVPRIVSIALRQETAEHSLDALMAVEALHSQRIRWTTNVDLLEALLGKPAIAEPEPQRPFQVIREQMAKHLPINVPLAQHGAPPQAPAGPVAPPVVIPSIQVPQIKT